MVCSGCSGAGVSTQKESLPADRPCARTSQGREARIESGADKQQPAHPHGQMP